MAQEEAVNSVVDKVVDLVFGKAKEEISYMWNCSKSVEDLETKKENLTLMKGRVLQQITAAEDREDRLLVGVEEWVAKAESHITEAIIKGFDDNANKTCLNLGMCMDLGTLYHYGKAAANEARSLLQHQKDWEEFEARGLVNLETLTIKFCGGLEEVIGDGNESDNSMVVFRRLVKIELLYLSKLKSFYAGNVIISCPSLVKVEILNCGFDVWDNKGTFDTPNHMWLHRHSSYFDCEVDDHIDMEKEEYPEYVNHAVGRTKWPDALSTIVTSK